MKEDLIFHLVTKEDWQKNQRYGLYHPELRNEEGFIHCSASHQIQKTANTRFKGRKNLLLIVIDYKMLASPVKMEDTTGEGEKFPHIYGPLNLDAVLDKIRLDANENGLFEIEFESS